MNNAKLHKSYRRSNIAAICLNCLSGFCVPARWCCRPPCSTCTRLFSMKGRGSWVAGPFVWPQYNQESLKYFNTSCTPRGRTIQINSGMNALLKIIYEWINYYFTFLWSLNESCPILFTYLYFIKFPKLFLYQEK